MLVNNIHIGTVHPNNVLVVETKYWYVINFIYSLISMTIFKYYMILHKMIGEISNQLTLVSLQETWCKVDRPQDCKFSDRNYYSSLLSTSRLISLRR